MRSILILLLTGILAACDAARGEVMIATTTSVEDTGLLDALVTGMREDLPDVHVRYTAVGSGQALALARRRDADLVIVHDPAAESTFVAEGHGDRRRTIMRNDFVIVGPPADPADVRTAADAAEAMRRIRGHLFLSRGDSSGTHRKELALWRAAGVVPAGDWYREAGIGQGDLVRMASERGGYALVDRASFRFLEGSLDLDVLFQDPRALDNPYSVIVATNSANAQAAHAVADWLTGDRAADIIDRHGRDRFGSPLFDVVQGGSDVLFVATTTVEDSGLLEALAAALRRDLPDRRVRIVAVGSGQALTLARRGDADLVMVHDPAAESTFVAAGHGDRRRTIMHNAFVLIGPEADPARARAAPDVLEALRRIARSGAPFLSRGDSSGTHRKELELWRLAGVSRRGAWYREAGIGQGDLIRMADERRAYAIVDRGTLRSLEPGVDVAVLQDRGPSLDNPYSVIVAARARNAVGARAVADWLAGPRAAAVIRDFGRAEHGAPLFDVVAAAPSDVPPARD